MTQEARMLIWELITGGAIVVMVASRYAYVINLRRHPSAPARRRRPEICIYLDEDNAMDLYLQGDYPYLQRTIEETSRRNTVIGMLLRFLPLRWGVQHSAGKEQIIKYFEDVGPITVIGRIIRALDDAGDIVYVDLLERTIRPDAGLDRLLESKGRKPAKQAHSARLRDLESDTYVSVVGRFKTTDESEKTTTFSAPHGESAQYSGDPPQVSVTCINKHLRRDDRPDPPFRARCLGKINRNPATGELKIYPVLAIFQ
jgi:hypothetical protein